jgi:hypothetical protein
MKNLVYFIFILAFTAFGCEDFFLDFNPTPEELAAEEQFRTTFSYAEKMDNDSISFRNGFLKNSSGYDFANSVIGVWRLEKPLRIRCILAENHLGSKTIAKDSILLYGFLQFYGDTVNCESFFHAYFNLDSMKIGEMVFKEYELLLLDAQVDETIYPPE